MGNRLRELRNEKGFSQTQLAIKFNLGKSTVSHYENSERDIPSEMIIKFSEYFNVTADYFLGISSIRNEILSANNSIVFNAIKNIDFQKFTNNELIEFIALMKENAKYFLSRHVEPSF